MRPFLIPLLFLLAGAGLGQVAPNKYFITFTDKNGTPYTIDHPEQFLTQRAIDRRVRQGIPVIGQDLPVNPSYVAAVSGTGVTVLTRSRWFNGITIFCPDPALLDTISKFPFVLNILKSAPGGSGTRIHPEKSPVLKSAAGPVPELFPKETRQAGAYNYGPSYNQIHMMNGDILHNQGYRGQGMVIAVLDAGFLHVDSLKAFDSLRAGGQILGTKDFVTPHGDVYHEYYHGMMVLSVMAADLPGVLIGTAPRASYWLLRSEDANSENIIEEYNWVCAAEFADSVGADVINSSLGYTQFDDPSQDHTCADMTGNTTPATRGANIAASKGMMVISSAGNLGGTPWTCLSAPSDGYNILCAAAVDSMGHYASFSSTGFINDTLVKPTVASQGKKTFVAGTDDTTFFYGSGTSFSSPLLTGLTACLWQSHPGIFWKRILQSIEECASQYDHPDTLLGYGIPDFSKALQLLGVPEIAQPTFHAYPNPFRDSFTLDIPSSISSPLDITIYTMLGTRVYHGTFHPSAGEGRLRVDGLGSLSPGVYFVRCLSGNSSENISLVKTAE